MDCGNGWTFKENSDFWQFWYGLRGPAGPAGPQGRSVELRGPVASVSDLPATAPASELWQVGTQAPYNGYFFTGAAWVNLGPVAAGATFTPTVSSDGVISWTNDGSLPNPEPVNIKGPQGETGATGPQGPQGATGATGPAGPGVPAGGSAGKVLKKQSATDYDSAWGTEDLGITGASVGDLVRISAVSGGKPTAFEKISDPNGNIGIVQNTNIATQNITKGQYVIWKGALYTASSAIASGATLSGSNLTAVTGGGLNELAYFTPGKRYTFGFFGCAFVSDAGKSLTLSITSGKRVLGIPTIESLKVTARGVNGYVDIFNYSLPEVVGNTDFSITVASGTNFLEVKLLKTTALTNTTNNTPVTVNGEITFLA